MTITWEHLAPTPPTHDLGDSANPEESLATDERLRTFMAEAVAAGEPVLLLVNDPHRPTQTAPVLRQIARCAESLALSPRFRALIATGTHRFTREEERAFELAVFMHAGLVVESMDWHRATEAATLRELAGVRLHYWLDEHRYLLPIGSVEPHYFAGVTGPHKTITVGCMAPEDIERNHAHALSPDSNILRLRGNPVFDGVMALIDELDRLGKHTLAIGQIICGDRLLAVEMGDCHEVLEALIPRVRQVYLQTIAAPVDVLELRVPSPLGRHLYQADKALKNNHLAVRDGGGILLVADCEEGIGPDAFLRVLRSAGSYEESLRLVERDGYRLGDHKAVKLRHLMDADGRQVHVALVSPHLAPATLAGTGFEVFASHDSAMSWLTRSIAGPVKRGLIIEDAGMMTVLPAAYE